MITQIFCSRCEATLGNTIYPLGVCEACNEFLLANPKVTFTPKNNRKSEETRLKISLANKKQWERRKEEMPVEVLRSPEKSVVKCGHPYWWGERYTHCKRLRDVNEPMCNKCKQRQPQMHMRESEIFCSKHNENFCIDITK